MPGLFDLVEKYFDPENANSINFSRYKSELYLKNFDTESEISANATTGLLLSGLLKRFESSTGAFISSISKIIEQHKNFLKALDAGYVVSTEFLTESLGSDDEEFDEFLDKSTNNYPIEQFNTD